jgi:hypothetical protein
LRNRSSDSRSASWFVDSRARSARAFAGNSDFVAAAFAGLEIHPAAQTPIRLAGDRVTAKVADSIESILVPMNGGLWVLIVEERLMAQFAVFLIIDAEFPLTSAFDRTWVVEPLLLAMLHEADSRRIAAAVEIIETSCPFLDQNFPASLRTSSTFFSSPFTPHLLMRHSATSTPFCNSLAIPLAPSRLRSVHPSSSKFCWRRESPECSEKKGEIG